MPNWIRKTLSGNAKYVIALLLVGGLVGHRVFEQRRIQMDVATLLSDDPVKRAAVLAPLTNTQTNRVVTCLLPYLETEDVDSGFSEHKARRALVEMGPPVVDRLLHEMERCGMHATIRWKRMIPTVERRYRPKTSEDGMRMNLAIVLAAIADPRSGERLWHCVVPMYWFRQQGGDFEQMVFAALARMGEPAVEFLFRECDKPQPVSTMACDALIYMGRHGRIDMIIERMQNPQTQMWAVHLLGLIGDETAIEPLERALAVPHPLNKELIVDALQTIRNKKTNESADGLGKTEEAVHQGGER